MSAITSFFRIIKFAFQDFFRNFWLSIITISIIVLALFSVNILLVLTEIARISMASVEEKVDITVNFHPNVPASQIESVKQYIESVSEVESVTLKSQEEVLEEFRKKYEENEAIQNTLNILESNPLGAALIVKAKDLNGYEKILLAINDESKIPSQIIRDRNFATHKALIERLDTISQRIREIGIGISAVFFIITVLIVFNTIRVAIYTHRFEIAIMRLVGAGTFFTRAPFLLHAIILSAVSLAATLIIWYPLLGVLQPYFSSYFYGLDFNLMEYFNKNFATIFGKELLGIIALNVVSAYLAVRRYLYV